eukprot:3540288-Rhodomonas_salina.2
MARIQDTEPARTEGCKWYFRCRSIATQMRKQLLCRPGRCMSGFNDVFGTWERVQWRRSTWLLRGACEAVDSPL